MKLTIALILVAAMPATGCYEWAPLQSVRLAEHRDVRVPGARDQGTGDELRDVEITPHHVVGRAPDGRVVAWETDQRRIEVSVLNHQATGTVIAAGSIASAMIIGIAIGVAASSSRGGLFGDSPVLTGW